MEQEKCIFREMNCELNQLSMPDGSAMFMQGDTCVAAGVYGPIEARLAKMMYDKAHIEVVFNPMKGPPSIDGRMKELYIEETCKSTIMIALHPGTAISINLQEMENAGGLLACAINAANLALINSSLSMKFTIAAIHCMIDKDSGKIILDPEESQLQNARATFTYAFDSMKKDLITCHTSGKFTEKELMNSIKQCREACKHIFDFYREVVKKIHVFIVSRGLEVTPAKLQRADVPNMTKLKISKTFFSERDLMECYFINCYFYDEEAFLQINVLWDCPTK